MKAMVFHPQKREDLIFKRKSIVCDLFRNWEEQVFCDVCSGYTTGLSGIWWEEN